MQSAVRPSAPKLPMNPSQSTPTQYLVYSADDNHVGPVSAELIGRGVVAGKVPEDAYVAPAGSTAWAPLAAFPDIVDAMRTHKSSLRPAASFGALHTPPPPPPPAVPQDLFAPASSPPASLPLPQIHAAPTVVAPPPQVTVIAPPPSVNVPIAPLALAPVAPAPAPAPAEAAPPSLAAPVPSAAEPKKEEKKEEKKPALDPKWKLMPVAIFGVFGFIAVLETIIVLVARR